MKRKALILGLLVIFLAGCITTERYFVPQGSRQKVEDHGVAVATYYEMSEEQYARLEKVKNYRELPIFIKWDKKRGKVTIAYLTDHPTFQQIPREEYLALTEQIGVRQISESTPIFIKQDKKTRKVTVAYLGAGAIIKNNYILTVNHLFDKEDYYNFMNIWVFKKGVERPIQAELVARTKCERITQEVHYYDYALIHLKEDLGLPGLKIAKPNSVKMGEKVMFFGSTGGFAFFLRFGVITRLKNYFQKDLEGKLKLSSFEKFPFWTVYPGGPGDSGGFVANIKGEIVTVMYCGVTNYSEEYIFGNPTWVIWKFLKEYKLEHLAR